MSLFILVLYISALFCKPSASYELLEPIVSLSEGTLRGIRGTNIFGETIFRFLGVPYGESPVGNLRFKAPEPAKPWRGIKNATEDGDPCYNRNIFHSPGDVIGGENCLVLNVFTKPIKLLIFPRPVMVYLHEGGFISGFNDEAVYNPAFLLTENIVVVVINYRLGLSGFLSLEDDSLDVPGNAGLKDQILALKWVQRNIKKFGGNPNDVTIFGASAGAASVQYHILSPASRGLFHKAILQSGSAFCPWARGTRNGHLVAKALGIPKASEKEVLKILRNMTGYEVFQLQEKVFDPLVYGTLRPFVPVIEKNSLNAVFTKDPFKYISTGDYYHVPMLIGYNSNEGLVMEFIRRIQPSLDAAYNYTTAIPWYMFANKNQTQKIENLMTQIYSSITDPRIRDKLVMDSVFLAPIAVMIKNHFKTSKQIPIYVYRTSVDTQRNYLKVTKNITNIPGTSHGDDLGFIWNPRTLPEVKFNTLEALTVYRFVKLYTNFAKFGNPTPTNALGVKIPPLNNAETFTLLNIGKDLKIMNDLPERRRIQLWKKIYQLSPFTANYL